MDNNLLWQKQLKDGTRLEGVCGGNTHAHETGFASGHVRIEKTGERVRYNRFNAEVSELLRNNGVNPNG